MTYIAPYTPQRQPSASGSTQTRYTITPEAQRLYAAFFRWLYEDQRGYMEIVAGRTNPNDASKIAMLMRTRRWCYYDSERPDLTQQAAAYVATLAQQYGNVYCGVRLYTRQAKDTNTRSEATTLPSRVIFVDDVTDLSAAPVPFSLAIQTSTGKYHGYYKCDTYTTKDDVRRVTAALRGDASGVDLTQLVRIPGTFNTKHKKAFAVARAQRTAPVSLEQIRATFPAVAGAERQRENTPAASDAAHWSDLPDGAVLARSARYTRAFAKRPQLATIAAGERVMTFRDTGAADDSLSAQRAVFCNNLLNLYQQAPANEVRALALHYKKQIGPDMEISAFQRHIDLCIADYTPKDYQPQPTRFLPGQRQRTEAERSTAAKAPRGRASDHTALVERVYTLLQEHRAGVQALVKIDELASAAGVHRRTVATCLDDLEQAGRISRTRQPGGLGLLITFADVQRDVIYSADEASSERTATPQTDEAASVPLESTPEHEVSTTRGCVLSEASADHISAQHSEAPAAPVEAAPGWIIVSNGPPHARRYYGWHEATNDYTDWHATRAAAIAATWRSAPPLARTPEPVLVAAPAPERPSVEDVPATPALLVELVAASIAASRNESGKANEAAAVAFVQSVQPGVWSEKAVHAAYASELARQRYARQDARTAAKAATLKTPQVEAIAESTGNAAAKHHNAGNYGRAYVERIRSGIFENELSERANGKAPEAAPVERPAPQASPERLAWERKPLRATDDAWRAEWHRKGDEQRNEAQRLEQQRRAALVASA